IHDLAGNRGGTRRGAHVHARALNLGRIAAALRLDVRRELRQRRDERGRGGVAVREILFLRDLSGLVSVVGRGEGIDGGREDGERGNGRAEARVAGQRGFDVVGFLKQFGDGQLGEAEFDLGHSFSCWLRRRKNGVVEDPAVVKNSGRIVVPHFPFAWFVWFGSELPWGTLRGFGEFLSKNFSQTEKSFPPAGKRKFPIGNRKSPTGNHRPPTEDRRFPIDDRRKRIIGRQKRVLGR